MVLAVPVPAADNACKADKRSAPNVLLCKNKTVITIDHNLSTVKESDSIIVMEKGRVHAQGTHTELLENSEVYKRLWHKGNS
ncbi:hypothetical protein V1L52_05235 [Treponema sp. HNW]|uniref:hypothetical protein n=1 Tax=Treponema sp. HNW TaxID=3116654 RepID=UPI003D099063